jgi:hypothetical protein
MQKKKTKKPKIKDALDLLLAGGFFDGKGKTALETVKKLSQKGFTIKGRKVGMVARMLTQMCQDFSTGLERDELPRERRAKNEMWIFKRSK